MTGRLIEWHTVRTGPTKPSSSSSSSPPTTLTTKVRPKRSLKTTKQRLSSKLYNLTLDISALQQQVNDLAQHRALLYTRALYTKFDADGSVVQKTRTFVELAQPGPELLDLRARSFIGAVVDEDVAFSAFRGRDQFLTSWAAFSSLFAATTSNMGVVQVASFDRDEDTCTVRVDTKYHGTLTLAAIRAFYPAVLDDPALARKLCGTPVDLCSRAYQTYGPHGRITRIEADMDFIGALARLVDDVVRAGQLIEQAAQEKQGVIYRVAEAEKAPRSVVPPRVEELYDLRSGDEAGIGLEERGEKGSTEPQPSVNDRHTIDFLLS